ncbi:MAG: family 10 glycosylhydrolase [Phycisphaerales bacterium]|nr:family 10 glycosylhydrolase [Phycisphaerales bacterium]
MDTRRRTANRTRVARAAFVLLALSSLALALGCSSNRRLDGEPGTLGDERDYPPLQREFRGAWVATVANIDWPSKPGLPVEEQKAELVALMNRAMELNLNAIVFQVRPACDAFYASELEPWSEYLTGTQGVGPEPEWDPLAFACDAAHARGMQLHAWFNPFRARQKDARSAEAATHISRTQPGLVRRYGEMLWLDPGDPAARQHSLRVMLDVVKRYNVDGVHIDDYFYPYPVKEGARTVPFPDDPTWEQHGSKTGLSRDDWRRSNINTFVRDLYAAVKREKPQVLVGISPFGIWRPGNPPGIKGFDAYEAIYADSLLWLRSGWCDYLSPQLYWPNAQKDQSYPELLKWWRGQNTLGRHLWIGNFTSKLNEGWKTDEIVNQIGVTRELGAGGNIHFSMKALLRDYGGVARRLADGPYATAALVPTTPWLGEARVAAPEVRLQAPSAEGRRLVWRVDEGNPAFLIVVRAMYGEEWRVVFVPAGQGEFVLPTGTRDAALLRIAVSAVDRHGRLSAPVVFAP